MRYHGLKDVVEGYNTHLLYMFAQVLSGLSLNISSAVLDA